jgi:hypothetical protein
MAGVASAQLQSCWLFLVFDNIKPNAEYIGGVADSAQLMAEPALTGLGPP